MWPDDPKLRSAALELYGAVWEGVPPGIEQALAWGSDWFQVSTPFLVRSEERLLAHAGVVECDLAVAGQRREIAAVHGVCVHPDHQGLGLGRQVLEAALAHIDHSRATTAILWSEKVDLYRKFAFEPCLESVFTVAAPKARATHARRLNLEQPDSVDRLLRALRQRQPVSEILAAADTGWHFLINLGLWAEARDFLIDLPEHDVVMVAEVEGSLLSLYDVLGPTLPSVADLVGAARAVSETEIEEIEIYFSPDQLDLEKLGLETRINPHPLEDVLMVRGERLPENDVPFALSPFSRT